MHKNIFTTVFRKKVQLHFCLFTKFQPIFKTLSPTGLAEGNFWQSSN